MWRTAGAPPGLKTLLVRGGWLQGLSHLEVEGHMRVSQLTKLLLARTSSCLSYY